MENTQFILELTITGKFDSKEQYMVKTMIDQKTALQLAAEVTTKVGEYVATQSKASAKKEEKK